MNISYLHLCDYAIIDKVGKPSAMGIFSGIASATFPAVQPGMYILFESVAVGAEINVAYAIRIDLTSPDGKSLFRIDGEIKANGVPAPMNRVMSAHIVRIPPVQFPSPGDYAINIFLDGKPAAHSPLLVTSGANIGKAK